jgi:hypothetical protein
VKKLKSFFRFSSKAFSRATAHKTTMEQAIQHIRNITRIYEQFANQPEWFIENREHSIIISLNSFADTATKLNNSDNYKPTDEEDNYWEWMMAEVEEFDDKLVELIRDPQEYHARAFWVEPLISALMTLYTKFNGRVCENGLGLERVGEELD